MTDRYNGLPNTPDEVEPFQDDSWKADAHRDLCIPESAEDKARWERTKREFAAKWLPLINFRIKQAS
jgi:hypothetical protein